MSYEPFIDGQPSSYYEDEDATGPNLFGALAIFAWRNAVVVLAFWLVAVGFAVWALIAFTPAQFNDAPGVPVLKLKIENAASTFSGLEKIQSIQLSNDNSEILESQRQVLVNTLKARPQIFDLVFSPGLGDYYDANAMLYRPLAEVKGRVAYALSLQPLFNAVAQQPSAATMATLVNEISAAIEQGRDPQGLEDLLALSARSIDQLMKGADSPVDWSKIGTLDVKGLNANALILALPQTGQELAAQELTTKLLNIISQSSDTSVEAQFANSGQTELWPIGEPIVPQTYFWSIFAAALVLGLAIFFGKMRMIFGLLLPATITGTIALSSVLYFFGAEVLTLSPVIVLIVLVALVQASAYVFAINVETEKDFAAFAKVEKDAATGNSIARAAQYHGADLCLIAGLAFLAFVPLMLVQTGYSLKLLAVILGLLILSVTICLSCVSAFLRLFPNGIHWRGSNWFWPLSKTFGRMRIFSNLGMLAGFAAILVAGKIMFIDQQSVFQVNARDSSTNFLVSNFEQAQTAVKFLRTVPEAKALRWLGMFLPEAALQKREVLKQLENQFPRIMPVQRGIPEDLRDDIDTLQESLKNISQMASTKPELKTAAVNMGRSLALLAAATENLQVSQMENRLFGGFNRLADSADSLAQLQVPTIEQLPQELQRLFGASPGPFRIEVEPATGVSPAKLQTILSGQGFTTLGNRDVSQQQRSITWLILSAVTLILLALAVTILTIRQIFWATLTLALYVLSSLAVIGTFAIPMHFTTVLSLLAGLAYLAACLCSSQLTAASFFAPFTYITWPVFMVIILAVSYFLTSTTLLTFILPMTVFFTIAALAIILLGPARDEDLV